MPTVKAGAIYCRRSFETRIIVCFSDWRTFMATLNVNGKTHEVQVEGDTPLLWVIREQLGMTGTKYGCGVAACGACTVHLDGVATRSCTLPVSAGTEAQKVVTIEGLSPDGN